MKLGDSCDKDEKIRSIWMKNLVFFHHTSLLDHIFHLIIGKNKY